MDTRIDESKLRTHNQFDGIVSKALMEQHPDWSMETVREAALIATNTLLPLLPLMYTRKELEQAELRGRQNELDRFYEDTVSLPRHSVIINIQKRKKKIKEQLHDDI